MEKIIKEIEQIAKTIEAERDFSKVVDLFEQGAKLVKEVLVTGSEVKGRVLEIVRELDECIEKEVKRDGEEC